MHLAPGQTQLQDLAAVSAVPADVVVAPLRAEDRDAFLAAAEASRQLHHPWLQLPDAPAGFDALVARALRDDHVFFLLRHAACRDLVGFVNVSNIVRGAFLSASLGYGAFAGHDGRGLMTIGLGRVIDLAFGELGLHRVEANVQPGNARSLALLRRLGFEKEGFSPRFLFIDGDWRDHERWALRSEAGVGSALLTEEGSRPHA